MINRDFRNLPVHSVSTEELLWELIQRNELHPAPVKKSFGTDHHEVIISIGADDVAWMQIDVDSFQVLKTRIKKINPGM